jgi:hypothetical protein
MNYSDKYELNKKFPLGDLGVTFLGYKNHYHKTLKATAIRLKIHSNLLCLFLLFGHLICS